MEFQNRIFILKGDFYKKFKKVLYSIFLIICLCLYVLMAMGSSDSSSTDPDVKAYDDWWISTHHLDGSPR